MHDPTSTEVDAAEACVDGRLRIQGTANADGSRIDVPLVSHIVGNLWTGGCIQGAYAPRIVKHLFSLYPWEQYKLYPHQDRVEVEMYDSHDGIPESIDEIATHAASLVATAPTLIHCQAGLNRSGLIAALVLKQQGYSGGEAVSLLRAKRCNPDGSSSVLCNSAFCAHVVD